jgi:protein TonB
MDAKQTYSGQPLKSDLARYCLPATSRDPNRKLAWVNSICILFLLIGVAGSNPASIRIKVPPPLEVVIPTIIEQPPPPPMRVEPQPDQNQTDTEKAAAPRPVAVTLETPAINFSVPTVGNLLVPAALAQAPALAPIQVFTLLRNRVSDTGKGGDRPSPRDYPNIAIELGQQGTVLLSMLVDENGSITNIEVKESCGFSILDRSALEWVKRHWNFPPGAAGRIYEAPIKYTLQK